jgi:uncharacterized protein YqeY
MMSLTERINNDIKSAMLAKEKEKLAALRDIKSKLLLEATSGKGDVSEDIENKILLKLYKQRMETYQIYIDQKREDLANEEKFQAAVIEQYLPKMLSEEEIRQLIKVKIEALGASGPQDMGKVMGVLSKETAGKADGKLVSTLLKEMLAQ